MIDLTIEQAAQAMKARPVVPPGQGRALGRPFPDVSIDSRTLKPGECFFALRGPRFDGHSFVPQALERGASIIVAAESAAIPRPHQVLLEVAETLEALQALGTKVRQRWGGPLVAITGSAGKTTTRLFAARLLEGRLRVHLSPGNYNNDYGVPVSLTRLRPEHEFAVQELGMNHAGELRRLGQLCRPDAALITNVSAAHMEFFASLEEIAAAKAEILESLPLDGTFFYNADDPLVRRTAQGFPGRAVGFSLDRPSEVQVLRPRFEPRGGMSFELAYRGQRFSGQVPFAGRHHLYNLAAGSAVALSFGLDPGEILETAALLELPLGRGRILIVNQGKAADEVRIWDDSYNSNPAALQSVLETLAQSRPEGRVLLALGAMLELGPRSGELHRQAGRQAVCCRPDLLAVVGGQAAELADGALQGGLPSNRIHRFDDAEAAAGYLAEEVRPADFLLVKGSRGVKMERIIDQIIQTQSQGAID